MGEEKKKYIALQKISKKDKTSIHAGKTPESQGGVGKGKPKS